MEEKETRIHSGLICETCRWWDTETEVCCNGASDSCADFRCWYDWCYEWEGKA